MAESLTFSVRLILRALCLVALAAASAWFWSYKTYESFIALISAVSVVVTVLARDRSSTYDAIFSFIRIVAVIGCCVSIIMGGAVYFTCLPWFFEGAKCAALESPLEIPGLKATLFIVAIFGFCVGVRRSFEEPSIKSFELREHAVSFGCLGFLLGIVLVALPYAGILDEGELEKLSFLEAILALTILPIMVALMGILFIIGKADLEKADKDDGSE
jgi:uncharacterized membrane protein